MKKSQLNAISRSYADRRNKVALEVIESRGLLKEFDAKSAENFSYWSASRFLTHYEKYVQTAEERETRKKHLTAMIKSGEYHLDGGVLRDKDGKAVAYFYEY